MTNITQHLGNSLLRQRGNASTPAMYAGTVADVVADIRPALPLYTIFTDRLAANARLFTRAFPGVVAFAVKSNPDRTVISTLYKNGVKAFDVASIEEVRIVRKAAPKAKIYFMHPIKAPEAIAEAYAVHGVRTFVLDSMDELYKIMRNTDLAQDLELFVRLSLPKNDKAALDFSGKFGASLEDAAELLVSCRPVATRLGVSFHVGHQTSEPDAFRRAIRHAKAVINASNVTVDSLDVGGGFPVAFPNQNVPAVESFIDTIKDVVHAEGLGHMQLVCEPGRAMVATGASLIVRVEGRKDDTLYLNDGTYGGLYDAGNGMNWRFDVQAISANPDYTCKKGLQAFRFAGPTCDSVDMMEGPFMLPADIAAGDWIEVRNMGGYSQGIRSNFNGFGAAGKVILSDT